MTGKVRNFCRLGMRLASLYFFLFLFCGISVSADAASNRTLDRLSRHGASGRIAVRAGGKRFPGNAQVSINRTRSEDVKRRVSSGLKAKKGRKLKLGRHGAKPAQVQPAVLAMYDISISADGKKWQPDAGDPVQVTVELDEPVAVSATSELGVVHMADDGTVEELDSSKYGFTYNAGKTAVTAFWFSATGFSVYAIVDETGDLVTPRRFYHFYDHPQGIEGSAAVKTLPYLYRDEANDIVNVQIVKTGDELKEPPIPPDVLDEEGMLKSMFEGWYVVQTNARPANAVEGKLDSTNEYFQFVWPVGVTDNRLTVTNSITVTETEDTDYWVVPLYEHARFLQFNENTYEEEHAQGGGGQRIIDRKLVAINDETGWVRVKVSDVSAALVNSMQEYFCGWRYKDKNGQWADLIVYDVHGQPQDQYITIDDELFEANGGTVIPLYPVYVSAHFLNFDTNAKGSGATYVGSIFVRSTSDFSDVTPSGNRNGYNFTGWYAGTVENGKVKLGERFTDASGSFIANVTATNATGAVVAYTDASGYIRLNKDVTLYAGWEANSSASYRVIVWQQRVTDDKNAADADKKYYYVTHYTGPTVSATTQIAESMITSFSGTRADGASISSKNLETLSGKADTNAANEDFTGFHYARWSCEDATVAPDGSTVINVYYDRDLITLRFCLYQTVTNSTVVTGNSTSGTQYGSDDNGVTFYQIYYKSSGSNKGWYKTKSGNSYSNPYSGTRYTITTSGSWEVAANQTMTGLYGQTLEANGYTWPSGRAWKDGYNNSSSDGTSISFLDAFLPTSGGDETFYSSAESSSSGAIIYFYKEALDGSWTLANEYHSGSSSVSFNISDKYNGFEAYQYSKSGGAWTSVGTYNANTGYYGSQVSSVSDKLEIRFKRKTYELIYKDGDNTVYDTGKNVPYESSLSNYNYAVTNSVLNWGSRDLTVGTFEGWYEDASLTVPFDFDATMPDGKKFLYAKWAPIKYKVIVDPNGGEMQTGDSTWFYLDAGEKLLEYTVTRNYRLDMHNGTFYYHHDLWDPVKDKHTDQYDPSTAGAPRRAYYTLDIAEATSNEVSNPETRFSYEPKAYAFMGWYEVHADGTLATDPFNFNDPPNREITIRALWRRTGVYTLHYESVDPDGLLPDEVIYDPELGVDGGYIDDAVTTMAKDPTNYNKDDWVWEGWQVVDIYNGNIPLTNIRSPGDVYVVHESHADRENVIHFRAVYRYVGDGLSRHIPNVTDLILDSNENAGLAANATIPQREGSGTYTDGSSVSVGGFNQGVWFTDRQNNFSVNLGDYSDAFEHNSGYFLLGWDPLMHLDSLIPKYTAEQTIGIDKETDTENALYAIWEPQVYIELTNATEMAINDITLYIPSWIEGEVFRANTAKSKYVREVFSAFTNGTATFSLAVGESLRLVLPDGADRDFAVMGTCSCTEGTKLVITRIEPTVEGQETIPDVTQSVYPDEYFMVSGTMKVSPTPVQVVFTKTTYPTTTTVPVRYFLHDKSGTVTEITQYNAAYWKSQSYQTSLTVGSSVSDIAGMLRTDATSQSIHGLLADDVRTTYGHTTIGIGSASAVITTDHATLHANEYRSITQEDASGGPYFKFYHEKLEWSRYSQIWNGYDDPAIYVVFYKRTPVHVTIGKTVVGSEEDKSRTFDFTANITQHSTNLEYTVTTTYKQTREISITAYSSPSSSDWDTAAAKVAWGNPTGTQTNTSNATASSDQTPDLFEPRHPEQMSLADSARHPITIYYDSSEDVVGTPVLQESSQYGDVSSSGFIRKTYTRTQTKTTTQTVTYRVTYQYEVATVQEAASDLFTLTDIGRGAGTSHGSSDLSARTYTISSLGDRDSKGFFTYQSLDTAIFTNTRKTGSLTVSKTVVDGEAGDTFPFIVTLGETVVNKDSYTPPQGVHLGPYGKVFTFSLANGESVTLPGLPAGASYTVEEVAHDKYIATVPANATGTITESTTTVGFVNTHKVDLNIAMKDTSVIFTGEEQRGFEISSVTGTGAAIDTDGYTVTGLKNGHVLTVEHYMLPRGTTVGSYTGHVENVRFTVLNANDNDTDVTGEYIITMTPGALTIEPTPIVVTVTGNHETKVYNGSDQECLGYTYVITHAVTHEEITNSTVYVAIPPDYQTAWRKDVGRGYMSLAASHVIVTVPEGMSVSEIVVAANGYLEITPAPVTVKADDKAKIQSRPDPTLTATVTGLLGADVVDYALSRAVGETPGTYTITASGDASQGNYAVTYETGTLTIQALDLVQRSTGEGKSVDGDVEITDELIEALGLDSQSELGAADAAEILNHEDPNGLYRWENIVLGTDTNQVLLSTAVDSSAGAVSIAISRNEGEGTMEDLGYIVLQDLRRYTNNVWNRIAGPSAEKTPSFNIQMTDVSGNSLNAAGYYRVFTLLVPKSDLSITNEIPSTNIVGVLEVDSSLKNTMTAVPWNALAHDPAEPQNITVADYMTPSQLAAGDAVYAMNENGVYEKWTLKAATRGAATPKWQSSPTVVDSGDEDSVGVLSATPPAEERELNRDNAVWVERDNDTSKPYFLVGQYSRNDIQLTIGAASGSKKGATMVPNPTLAPMRINDYNWGNNPVSGDVITIPGVPNLSWSAKKKQWTRSVQQADPVTGLPVRVTVTDDEVPAGQSFWYYRKGATPFTLTIEVDKVD